jgi:hypothetical protein
VDAKYGTTWAGWCSSDPLGSHGVGLWKNIRKGWSLFCSHTRLTFGNGSRIRFWDDVWYGETPLNEAFPGLYGIARDKDVLVATHLVLGVVHFSGMLASFEWPTTRRWTSWLPYSPYCTPSEWNVKGKTSFGGLLLTKRNLMLDLSIRFLLAKRKFTSLGKVFGGSRFP